MSVTTTLFSLHTLPGTGGRITQNSIETPPMPSSVSLTHSDPSILHKIQAVVVSISGFLVKSHTNKIALTPEPVTTLN